MTKPKGKSSTTKHGNAANYLYATHDSIISRVSHEIVLIPLMSCDWLCVLADAAKKNDKVIEKGTDKRKEKEKEKEKGKGKEKEKGKEKGKEKRKRIAHTSDSDEEKVKEKEKVTEKRRRISSDSDEEEKDCQQVQRE
jgi:hypothetical protein